MTGIGYPVNGEIGRAVGATNWMYFPAKPKGLAGSLIEYVTGTDFFKTIGLVADISGNKSLKDHCGIAGGSTSLGKVVKDYEKLNTKLDAQSHAVRFKFVSNLAAATVWFSNACGKVPHVAFKILKELGATLDDVCTARHQWGRLNVSMITASALKGECESLVKWEPILGLAQTVSGFVLHSSLFAVVAFSVSLSSTAILTMATVYSVAFTAKFFAENARKDLEAVSHARVINLTYTFTSKSQ